MNQKKNVATIVLTVCSSQGFTDTQLRQLCKSIAKTVSMQPGKAVCVDASCNDPVEYVTFENGKNIT